MISFDNRWRYLRYTQLYLKGKIKLKTFVSKIDTIRRNTLQEESVFFTKNKTLSNVNASLNTEEREVLRHENRIFTTLDYWLGEYYPPMTPDWKDKEPLLKAEISELAENLLNAIIKAEQTRL